jgi:hypothetical protein
MSLEFDTELLPQNFHPGSMSVFLYPVFYISQFHPHSFRTCFQFDNDPTLSRSGDIERESKEIKLTLFDSSVIVSFRKRDYLCFLLVEFQGESAEPPLQSLKDSFCIVLVFTTDDHIIAVSE